MKHFSARFAVCLFTFVLTAVSFEARAQPKGTPAADLGWGSAWLEPANEQQRKEQELLGKIKAAQQAHDTRLQLELADRLSALTPNSIAPCVVRAYAHRQIKRYDQALADIDQGLETTQKQNRTDWGVNLLTVRASVHATMKEYGATVNDLQAALKLDDKNPAALNSLAWLRATVPDATFRNGPEAVRLAKRAEAVSTGYNSYETIDTLAAAYAEANDYGRAVDSEKRAMTAAEKEIKDAAKARTFQKDAAARLRLFEQHQAYHADLL